jgi:hypothetical protein
MVEAAEETSPVFMYDWSELRIWASAFCVYGEREPRIEELELELEPELPLLVAEPLVLLLMLLLTGGSSGAPGDGESHGGGGGCCCWCSGGGATDGLSMVMAGGGAVEDDGGGGLTSPPSPALLLNRCRFSIVSDGLPNCSTKKKKTNKQTFFH